MSPTGQKKRVIIVAMGGSCYEYFGLRQRAQLPEVVNGEVWAINLAGTYLRCDRVIHMDPFDEELVATWGPDTMASFASLKVPIYTSKATPLLPNSVDYPIHEVVAELKVPYFNTTVAYAIGLAIYEKFDEISLFGCDFTYPDYHAAEKGRACAEFWLRCAMDRGIKVVGGMSSTLFDLNEGQQLYGYRKRYDELVAD